MVHGGVDSTDIQTFAIKLLANGKIPGKTFSALIASIFISVRTKQASTAQIASISVEDSETVYRIERE